MTAEEQPDGDPHGECAAEIHRLERELTEAKADADRWREAVRHVGAHRDRYGQQRYTLRGLNPDCDDLMHGSVAEHFTKHIDKARGVKP